jgi:hypothetical protein
MREENDQDIRTKVLRLEQEVESLKSKEGRTQLVMDSSQV